jgi:hypothetical protein
MEQFLAGFLLGVIALALALVYAISSKQTKV